MELIARHVENPAPVGIELVFTVAEEQGLRGAKALDVAQLRSPAGFVLDHAGPVGEVIVPTPTQQRIPPSSSASRHTRAFGPRTAAARSPPPRQRCARMELGRLDAETTANVGVIAAAPPATSSPATARYTARRGGLDTERAAERYGGRIADACAWGASERRLRTSMCGSKSSSRLQVPKDSAALGLAEAGLRAAGLDPQRVAIGGGSDANVFRRGGFDCVLLSNGTSDDHTSEERVPAKALDRCSRPASGIVAAAAEWCPAA